MLKVHTGSACFPSFELNAGLAADQETFGSARRNRSRAEQETSAPLGETARTVWWRTVSSDYLFLGTGCMIKLQSSMSKHIPQFCGVLGHTFMEFLKGSGDYCQAQHAAYADE
ncbi:hypothetical protein LDENG_00209920 [Lucifuga dentata]|nr:hypothetical protein LDENG_00209920 [Lucifuga dentata]